MFISPTIINLLAAVGSICLLGMLAIIVRYGPDAYQFARKEWAGNFPFDAPVWWYRIRKRVASFFRRHRAEIEAYLVLVVAFFLLWLGLVIVSPL